MSDSTNTTVIGAGTHIKGEITFDTTARILGSVEGSITSRGDLHIGETGQCNATLDAARIVIDGTVEGDVTARERVQLNAKAVVCGDLTTTSLSVAEGASFVGYCRVGPEASKLKVTEPAGKTNAAPRAAIPAASETINAAFAGLEAKFAAMSKGKNQVNGEVAASA